MHRQKHAFYRLHVVLRENTKFATAFMLQLILSGRFTGKMTWALHHRCALDTVFSETVTRIDVSFTENFLSTMQSIIKTFCSFPKISTIVVLNLPLRRENGGRGVSFETTILRNLKSNANLCAIPRIVSTNIVYLHNVLTKKMPRIS